MNFLPNYTLCAKPWVIHKWQGATLFRERRFLKACPRVFNGLQRFVLPFSTEQLTPDVARLIGGRVMENPHRPGAGRTEREMGREVRRVPPDWQHPKDDNDRLIPLHDGLSDALRRWHQENAQWDRGYVDDFHDGWRLRSETKFAKDSVDFEEYSGPCPDPADYMPDWPEAARTHFQMYEDTSEGTPISPVCESPEELAHWLADNNASTFADMGASYEQWLATINRGWAVSAVMEAGKGMRSGVEALAEIDD